MSTFKCKVTNGEVGTGVPFERIRRITGYLVGDLSRFNNAKYAEVNDRIKHTKRRNNHGSQRIHQLRNMDDSK